MLMGRKEETLLEYTPKGGIIGKTAEYSRRLKEMQISIHASHACYFLVLSLFPALVLVLGLLRYTALEAADLMDLLDGLVPDVLEPYIWRLISSTYSNTSKLVVSASAVTALWSASRGILGLRNGLNAVYGVEEKRAWIVTRGISALYTFLFLLVILLTLVLHVFGNTIEQMIHHTGDPRFLQWLDWIDLSFFVLVGAQTLLFCVTFMALPCRRNGFRESLPGALFASVGWMGFSALFSLYVENFTRYTNIFGSVYAVALGMLWLYMCVSIVFYGAALNRFLMEKQKK